MKQAGPRRPHRRDSRVPGVCEALKRRVAESVWWAPGAGRKDGAWLFNGYKVSVTPDEDIPELPNNIMFIITILSWALNLFRG